MDIIRIWNIRKHIEFIMAFKRLINHTAIHRRTHALELVSPRADGMTMTAIVDLKKTLRHITMYKNAII